MFEKTKFVTVTYLLVLIICYSFQTDSCKQEENVLKCTTLNKIFAVSSFKHVEDLIVDGSNLTEIDLSPLKNIRYLKNLTLIHSNLHTMKNTSFSNAKYILDINLSHNNIIRLPDHSFSGCSLLQRLSLAHNFISSLTSYQFSRLPSLHHLDLSHNNISSIHDDALSLMGAGLKSLLLHSNKLRTLHPEMLMPASKLNTISLGGNPWECDCVLRRLRDLVISRKLETNTSDDFRATCSGPEALAHKTWVSLSSHQFACPPHVTLTRDSVLCSSGDTCQVVCRVSGDPSPGIRWMVNRSLISDQNTSSYRMEVTAVTSSDMVSTLTSLASSVSGLYTCVAINSAGVSASSVRLSMGPRLLSVDLWLPILMGFLSVFCIFAGVICSVMCCRKWRRREKQNGKNNTESKPEIEFQYAETYLKEIEACDDQLGKNFSHENEKNQDYVTYQGSNFTIVGSNYSRNIDYHSKFGHDNDVSMLSKITEEPSTDLMIASNIVTSAPWGGQARSGSVQGLTNKTATIGNCRKAPPPTLPKPKLHS